ncbi:MAG: hypothetical protein JNM00_00575, partial [Flavobacteriales bacterium]|nr:hypothetical protein [Flavobacteriales bacterium]
MGLVGRANAQEKEIQLKHYGVADGLSDNTIRCLYFDSKGFLWIGTNEGLNRFDGEEFFHYRKRDKELFGLCGNVITDIVEDSRADLWIATRDGGICRMNRISGEMLKPVLFNDVSGAQVHYVHRLRFGTDSLLYVATDKGLFVSNRDYSRFHMAVKNKVGAFYDVMECEAGMIAAGISTSISVVGPDSLRPLTKEQAKKNGSGYIFNVLFKDLSGVIWGGAWDHHLHRFDAVSGTLTNYDVTGSGTTVYQNEEIYSITEVVSGELWLGMKSGTIWYYRTADGASGQVDISGLQTSTLNGNRIFDMITDPQGRTWIGTDAGLHVYNPLSSKF